MPDAHHLPPLMNFHIRHIVQSMHGIQRRQIASALKGLDLIEKAHRVYMAALNAGWSLDDDEWWWRPMKADDKHFDECHFGFTTRDSEIPGEPNCVFVRCPTYALAYDRGEITPYKKSHLAFSRSKV
ncbi:hypothetical protein QA639_21290 [Bradyrhizobium pachyrhizi]|uniref:hypothetical protein n=1 Tax=Bradyrhizobium pachyrhizi TaxID=280333 RepID=UPI0024B08799|nr:hypothetical protein [Bradyrhizobium pachyrhizi]WFU52245.1 hypothetical protein QA639_21290 [Bradyrhizobium pachyrhizi]